MLCSLKSATAADQILVRTWTLYEMLGQLSLSSANHGDAVIGCVCSVLIGRDAGCLLYVCWSLCLVSGLLCLGNAWAKAEACDAVRCGALRCLTIL